MMSPMCSRLIANEMISIARSPFAFVEAAACKLCHIELDGLVETIDAVVHPRYLIDQGAVIRHHRRHHIAQHDFDVVAHVQCFARGVCQSEGGVSSALSSRYRGRDGSVSGGRSGKAFLSNAERPSSRPMKIIAIATLKAIWKVGRQLREVRLPGLQRLRDRAEERRDQQHADQAIDQIADREPVAGGIVAASAFEQRIDRAAEIGSQYERQCAPEAR